MLDGIESRDVFTFTGVSLLSGSAALRTTDIPIPMRMLKNLIRIFVVFAACSVVKAVYMTQCLFPTGWLVIF